MTAPALELRDVAIDYGPIRAVDGVSLDLPEGELRAIVGANGAGKTTLLRAIFGLLRPTTGTIRVLGHDIRSLRPDQIMRLGVAWVPEGRQVWATLSVRENLAMAVFGSSRKVTQARVDEALDRFPRLRERSEQAAGSLSGGEQQLLALARALATRPKLFLLDEPSLGLAPLVIKDLFVQLGEIHAAGMTVLLVEQNAEQALRRSGWAYVMERGAIVKEGPSAALRDSDEIQQIYLGG